MLSQLLGAICKPWLGENRRRWRRVPRVTYVELQPLDEDLIPQGSPVWGMTRDISQHGIGLTTSFDLNCAYVQVEIREDGFTGFGMVRHKQDTATCSNPLYFIGIELIDKNQIIHRN